MSDRPQRTKTAPRGYTPSPDRSRSQSTQPLPSRRNQVSTSEASAPQASSSETVPMGADPEDFARRIMNEGRGKEEAKRKEKEKRMNAKRKSRVRKNDTDDEEDYECPAQKRRGRPPKAVETNSEPTPSRVTRHQSAKEKEKEKKQEEEKAREVKKENIEEEERRKAQQAVSDLGGQQGPVASGTPRGLASGAQSPGSPRGLAPGAQSPGSPGGLTTGALFPESPGGLAPGAQSPGFPGGHASRTPFVGAPRGHASGAPFSGAPAGHAAQALLPSAQRASQYPGGPQVSQPQGEQRHQREVEPFKRPSISASRPAKIEEPDVANRQALLAPVGVKQEAPEHPATPPTERREDSGISSQNTSAAPVVVKEEPEMDDEIQIIEQINAPNQPGPAPPRAPEQQARPEAEPIWLPNRARDVMTWLATDVAEWVGMFLDPGREREKTQAKIVKEAMNGRFLFTMLFDWNDDQLISRFPKMPSGHKFEMKRQFALLHPNRRG